MSERGRNWWSRTTTRADMSRAGALHELRRRVAGIHDGNRTRIPRSRVGRTDLCTTRTGCPCRARVHRSPGWICACVERRGNGRNRTNTNRLTSGRSDLRATLPRRSRAAPSHASDPANRTGGASRGRRSRSRPRPGWPRSGLTHGGARRSTSWSHLADSNRRPTAYEAAAASAELRRLEKWIVRPSGEAARGLISFTGKLPTTGFGPWSGPTWNRTKELCVWGFFERAHDSSGRWELNPTMLVWGTSVSPQHFTRERQESRRIRVNEPRGVFFP